MRRVIITDKNGTPLRELSPEHVYGLVRKEDVNGEHSLTIDTDMVLQKGWRILTQDGRGIWREHVVYSINDLHDTPGPVQSSCWCVWSVMYDLAGTHVSGMPGTQNPVAAGVALDTVLSGTTRWVAGTVTNTAMGGASMYDMSGWEAVEVMLDNWGGEIDTTIEVGMEGVTARKFDYYAQQGRIEANRRFDFGADLLSVKRTLEEGPLYCRVTPRGKGEATEGGGYGRKITIESVNGGRDYLEDSTMVPIAKLPDGNGGWEYPTVLIENSDCETPADLKAWAQDVMEDYTRPKVSYSVDVLQAAVEGVDAHGLSLGDAVHLVDRYFGDDGLRLSARVASMTVDMLNEADVTVVMGDVQEGVGGIIGNLAASFSRINNSVKRVVAEQQEMATAQYISQLLDRINAEINATGGYTYITEGQGLRTYDRAVTDPLVGAEASMVVELKGGNIRIANSKDSQGNWEWKTVLQSGHIIATLITAANLISGYIGSASSGNYWNLDTGEFRMAAASVKVGNKTLQTYIEDLAPDLTQENVFNALTNNGALQGLYMSNGKLYVNATYIQSGTLSANLIKGGTLKVGGSNNVNGIIQVLDASGNVICLLNKDGITATGAITLEMTATLNDKFYASMQSFTYKDFADDSSRTGYGFKAYGDSNNGRKRCWIAIAPYTVEESGESYATSAVIAPGPLALYGGSEKGYSSKIDLSDGIDIHIQNGSSLNSTSLVINMTYSGVRIRSNLTVDGNLSVSGTKPRLVGTEHYSDRLLYAYETPAPYFGDIGSAVTDENGECVVSVDDIFSETARTDMEYQVFLQACGEGNVYVAEKHATYFTVRGTSGLQFDWEVKAHQRGYEMTRSECKSQDDAMDPDIDSTDITTALYELYMDDYITEIEKAYAEEIGA